MPYNIAKSIPEFSDGHYHLDEYKHRLGPGSLTLVAHYKEALVDLKAGYPRGEKGTFYSWMGGVLPNYRRKGIAQRLAEEQEQWAKDQGYSHIWFKTRNRNRAMIIFALNNRFAITDVQPQKKVQDYRILMKKRI